MQLNVYLENYLLHSLSSDIVISKIFPGIGSTWVVGRSHSKLSEYLRLWSKITNYTLFIILIEVCKIVFEYPL